jgi:calcium binding protein 39
MLRVKRYEIEEVALSTGLILKEMIKHEPIARILLYSDQYVHPVLHV